MLYRLLVFVFLFSLMSCYVYKPMDKMVKAEKDNAIKSTNKRKVRKSHLIKNKNKRIRLTKEEAIKNLEKDAYYKVQTKNDKWYTIRYKKTTNDSIFGHKKKSNKIQVKLAKEDIKTIKSRRFHKLGSDLITFSIFGGIITTVILLLSQ